MGDDIADPMGFGGSNDDDDDFPLELLQESEKAERGPDMMSMLAHNMQKKQRQARRTERHRAKVRVTQEHKSALQEDIDAQKSFTSALNKHVSKIELADKAVKTGLNTLLKHRHERVDKVRSRFVPKSKAEMDHKKEVADDAKLQKKLA